MAVNQSQVDHILSTASADDPEVKLQNLQDEVDLLKKSVKKLLIDLRERMNEMDNPFIIATALPPVAELPGKTDEKIAEIPEPEIEEKLEKPAIRDEKKEEKESGYSKEERTAAQEEDEKTLSEPMQRWVIYQMKPAGRSTIWPGLCPNQSGIFMRSALRSLFQNFTSLTEY